MPASAFFFSWARLLVIGVAAAVAIWLIPASIHIVGWPPAGPVRVALLQPLAALWRALAVTLAVVGGAAVVAAAHSRARLVRLSSQLSPLLSLWLWALPFLPRIPDRAPLLLVFAGPIRWFIAAAAIVAMLWSAVSKWRIALVQLPIRRTIFAVSLAIYLIAGLMHAGRVGPAGDEPHYLIIAHSLLVDHDLDIENNHARGDYRAFYPGELRPDFLQRGRHGEIYSIHAPGLPALLLPAYAIAGYRGAVALMCLLAALTALAVFDLADQLAGRATALVTWAAVGFTIPFVPHAWLLFPETPGALVTAWAALWLWRPVPERASAWLARGGALAALPWLHTKFVVLLAMLSVFLLARLRWRIRAAAAFAAPIAIGAGLWLLSFYWMYGAFSPQVSYGGYVGTNVVTENIPRSFLGLLFDQKFGLLVYSPAYLLAFAGGWLMLRTRDRRTLAAALAVSAAAFVVGVARVYMWWGGSSAPARFLVPILPLLAPMIAQGVEELRSLAARSLTALLLGTSVIVAVVGVALPERQYLFSDAHGYARLAEVFQAGAPLAALLPTFTDENWHAPLRLLFPWLAGAAIASAVVAVVASRWRSGFPTLRAGVIGLVTLLVTASLTAGSPSIAARLETVNRGQLALMVRIDPPRLRGFDYEHFAGLDDRQIAELSTLVWRRAPGQVPDDPRRLVGPVELPPGRYELRIWFEAGRGADGEALVTLRNPDAVLARAPAPFSNPIDLPFDVDFSTDLWVGVTSGHVAKSIRRVEVAPVQIVPASRRPGSAARGVEPIAGWPGALIEYADDNTFPEGSVYWTRGTESGRVFITRPGARTIALTLHLGPNGGLVRIAVAGQDVSASLAPGETRQIQVPISTGDRLVPIDVRAPAAFRPADVERGSADRRWLGCQVRVELR